MTRHRWRSRLRGGALGGARMLTRTLPGLAEALAPRGRRPDLDTSYAYSARGPYLDEGERPLPTVSRRFRFGPGGVPMVAVPGGTSFHFNPVTTAFLGLQYDARARLGEATGHWENALSMAVSLVERQDAQSGLWQYGFDFPVAGTECTLKKPWGSAMAQGLAISLLTRMADFRPDARFEEAATHALGPLRRPVDRGGLCAMLDGQPFFEEYPTDPPSYTLNGFMYTLLGLYDLAERAENSEARELFDAGVQTLRRTLHLFDLGGHSAYHLGFLVDPTSAAHWSLGYHWIHVQLLTAIDSVAPDQELRRYRDRWLAYRPRFGDPR